MKNDFEPSVVFFTNIATPYRTEFYNDLYAEEFNFEVWYMRDSVKYRPWVLSKMPIKHPYYVNNGIYFQIKNFPLFFNPGLLFKALYKQKTDLILGLSWNDPDVLILIILKRMGFLHSRIHFWSEANHLTIGSRRDNFFKKILRKFVYNAVDGVQLRSGKMTEITMNVWGINPQKYVDLPNTIQELKINFDNKFLDEKDQTNTVNILMVARLTENLKGIINFFKALSNKDISDCQFYIAGDGNDKQLIQDYIDSRGSGAQIHLIGQQSPNELLSLYSQVDIFCLPSFSDPSPLSVIEALYAGLPLLISNRCGNHYEAVKHSENGYIFDPDNKIPIQKNFRRLVNERDRWSQMSISSKQIYDNTFSKKMVINNFISGFVNATKQ